MSALSLAATESEQIELAAVQNRHSLYNDLLQVPDLASRRRELAGCWVDIAGSSCSMAAILNGRSNGGGVK